MTEREAIRLLRGDSILMDRWGTGNPTTPATVLHVTLGQRNVRVYCVPDGAGSPVYRDPRDVSLVEERG